jgi:hypothetical protein
MYRRRCELTGLGLGGGGGVRVCVYVYVYVCASMCVYVCVCGGGAAVPTVEVANVAANAAPIALLRAAEPDATIGLGWQSGDPVRYTHRHHRVCVFVVCMYTCMC